MPVNLPQKTEKGQPAKAWCHVCVPVKAFASISDLQKHAREAHGDYKA